jgi:hypothetical protein
LLRGGSIACDAPEFFDSLQGSFQHHQAAEEKPLNVIFTEDGRSPVILIDYKMQCQADRG